jgi:hypothetical protein
LFIDVYTPSGASETSKLPVWFFIQGGGYIQNSNANYNGTGVIVESGRNIVVVNFNYRVSLILLGTYCIATETNLQVSAFGFLASERVTKDGTLNVGLLDQRKALLWVQKYISKVCNSYSLPSVYAHWNPLSSAVIPIMLSFTAFLQVCSTASLAALSHIFLQAAAL